MLHFDKWSGRNEEATIKAQRLIARGLLALDYNVIVDDTNLGQSHKDSWEQLAKDRQANFEVKTFDTTPWECINRDAKREKSVGRAVILNMAMQYDLIPELKNIVVCDIDGTVADGEHRVHHLEGEKKDWKTYFSLMGGDRPQHEVYTAAMEEAVANDGELIFVSARPEDYRKETEDWLHKHGMDYMHLIMRPQGNKRPDTEVKQKVLDKYLKNYNIVKVYDDRPAVIRMWRENGLKVEDVGNGIEF